MARRQSRKMRRGGQNDPNVPNGSTGLSNESPSSSGLSNITGAEQDIHYSPPAASPASGTPAPIYSLRSGMPASSTMGKGRSRRGTKKSRKSRKVSRRR